MNGLIYVNTSSGHKRFYVKLKKMKTFCFSLLLFILLTSLSSGQIINKTARMIQIVQEVANLYNSTKLIANNASTPGKYKEFNFL